MGFDGSNQSILAFGEFGKFTLDQTGGFGLAVIREESTGSDDYQGTQYAQNAFHIFLHEYSTPFILALPGGAAFCRPLE